MSLALSQFLATVFLVLTVFAATDRNNGPSSPGLVPVAVFFAMVGITAVMGAQTSFSMNPARDLGPRMMSAMFYGREGKAPAQITGKARDSHVNRPRSSQCSHTDSESWHYHPSHQQTHCSPTFYPSNYWIWGPIVSRTVQHFKVQQSLTDSFTRIYRSPTLRAPWLALRSMTS